MKLQTITEASPYDELDDTDQFENKIEYHPEDVVGTHQISMFKEVDVIISLIDMGLASHHWRIKIPELNVNNILIVHINDQADGGWGGYDWSGPDLGSDVMNNIIELFSDVYHVW